jgi:hypothetical protein
MPQGRDVTYPWAGAAQVACLSASFCQVGCGGELIAGLLACEQVQGGLVSDTTAPVRAAAPTGGRAARTSVSSGGKVALACTTSASRSRARSPRNAVPPGYRCSPGAVSSPAATLGLPPRPISAMGSTTANAKRRAICCPAPPTSAIAARLALRSVQPTGCADRAESGTVVCSRATTVSPRSVRRPCSRRPSRGRLMSAEQRTSSAYLDQRAVEGTKVEREPLVVQLGVVLEHTDGNALAKP